MIAFDALYESMLKCKRGVSWKASVAHFILNSLVEVEKLSQQLQDGTYKERPLKHFKVYRPKERDIVSICFRDRVYQRSLNDNVVFPECAKHLIYDNCACQKGKGTDFARSRLKTHLQRYYRKHGADGWVLQIDIHGYYPSMRHEVAKEVFRKYLDDDIYKMVCDILDSYGGEVGFNPGSQLVQIAGISVLNELDHKIKEEYRIEHFVKYMDDFVLVSDSKEQLEIVKSKIEKELEKKGFTFNEKKTKIFPLKNGIEFLGFRFLVRDTGKVLMFVLPEKVKSDRRNIRKLAKMVADGRMTEEQYFSSYQSRRSHYLHGDSKKLLWKMDSLVKEALRDARREFQNSILAEA